jgi:hypothetical protein
MIAYLSMLLLIAGPMALIGRGAVERCASVLMLNWLAGYCFNAWFGTFTPWAWSALIDTVSAVVILWHPAGRAQAILGGSYVAQLVCHFLYAATSIWTQHEYWQALTFIAWAQLAVLGIWGAKVGYSSIAGHFWGGDKYADNSHKNSVGKS